ncbi:MAG: LPS-assembly protein LptD [Myxococcaceae bacterium]
MSSLVPVALALLAAAPAQEVELTADKLVSDPTQHVLIGHAVMRTDDAVLRADEIVYRRAEQLATARGHVTLAVSSGGLFGAVAEAVTLKLDGRQVTEVFVTNGRILQKSGVTPEQLFAAASPGELERAGHTSMTLSGTHMVRGPEGERWTVDDLVLNPCDCDPKEAGFRVEAPRAHVDLESRRASIHFPTVYVKSVPVFWLPWLNLPLSTRATGFLVPRPTFFGQNGFGLDVPLFVTLGRSYDLTLTPGFFTGRAGSSGVTGPRLQTELRYVPSEQTRGRASLGLLYDFRRPRDPVDPNLEGDGRRGLRWEGQLQHSQELGRGWFDRVDASYLSDGYFQRDLSADVFVREAGYLRSTGTVFHRGEQLFAGLDVGVIQDLRWGYKPFGSQGPATLQRLPAVVVEAPERQLAGPLHGSFRAEYTRHSPIGSLTGDEGADANEGRDFELPAACLQERLFWPTPLSAVGPDGAPVVCPAGVSPPDSITLPDGRVFKNPAAGQGDRVFQPGEREARNRLDLRPRLSASFRAGEVARFTPYVAYRQDLYLGEVTGKTSQRGYPLGGLLLDTELGRTFGEGQGALRHSIAPSAELRYVPVSFGKEPAPYDDVDLALPREGRLLQAVAQVRQRLVRREGPAAAEVLAFDLGQGFDLLDSGEGVRDSYARLAFSGAPLTLTALVRADLPQGRIAQASAGFSLDNGRGDALFCGYDQLFNGGSDQTRRGIDALVGPPPRVVADVAQQDFAQQVVAGFRTRLKLGLALEYSAIVARTAFPGTADPSTGRPKEGLALGQQRLALSYGPACDCWRVEAWAVHNPTWDKDTGQAQYLVFPALGASLTIAGFGTLGTGG